MLTSLRVQRYKSLFDVAIDFEPLTVFIGPNGSGKSNIYEAVFMFASNRSFVDYSTLSVELHQGLVQRGIINLQEGHKLVDNTKNKFWRGDIEYPIRLEAKGKMIEKCKIYNFAPYDIMKDSFSPMQSSGEGIANALAEVLFDDRDLFIELEKRFTNLVPNVSRISLKQKELNRQRVNSLRLADKHSDYLIPANDISDGTLRLLAFLAALYDVDSPDIICFEEPENGVHPWLLGKIMELLNQIARDGIRGKPTQIIVTTHSPILLNYVEPEQIRAVELDEEGKTQVHALPVESKRFQKALEAYEGDLGELWFTNLFGGNPS
ncbi:MAG: ATP-binding protein [Chloroflexota bacterium]